MAGTARACRAGVPTQSPARGAPDPAPHSGAAFLDPDVGKVTFGKYAARWIDDQVLKPRTEELYRGLLKNHLASAFGSVDLCDIREADIRRWRKKRLEAGPRQERPFGPVTVAKAYRLLHAVLNTAAHDQLIRRNPCRIKGAGQEDSPERAVIPLATLIELLDQVPPRYRALVLLATFASLRFGELAGLRCGQVDLDGCGVRIVISTAETDDGRLIATIRNHRPDGGAWHSRKKSPRNCTGTWSASPSPVTTVWSSSARRAAGCGAAIGHATGHAAGNTPLEHWPETDDHALDLGWSSQSGRRESNPHDQLGRRRLDPARPALTQVTVMA
jgi:integrase